MRAQGFTLVELLVTIAVMAIVLTLAVPGFRSIVNGNRLSAATDEFVAGLQMARIEAVRRGARVVACATADANAGDDAGCATSDVDGWLVFVDADRNGGFGVADRLLRSTTVDHGVAVSGVMLVSFHGDGMARDAAGNPLSGNVRLRIDASEPKRNIRCIALSTGGNAAVTTPAAHDGACP